MDNSGVKIYHKSMKRLLFMLFLSLSLLISCTSTDTSQSVLLNPAESRTELRNAFKSALLKTEKEVFTSQLDYKLGTTYESYMKDLPQFRRLCTQYIEEARLLLLSAVPSVVDYMFSYIDELRLLNPLDYLNKGYSSITDEAERTEFSNVKAIFLSHIQENSEDMKATFAELENEANIWKSNLSNLSLVGQGQDIGNIQAISDDTLAAYATKAFFSLLGENEISIRSTQFNQENSNG